MPGGGVKIRGYHMGAGNVVTFGAVEVPYPWDRLRDTVFFTNRGQRSN